MTLSNPKQLLEMLKTKDLIFVNGGNDRGRYFKYRILEFGYRGDVDLAGCVFYKCVASITERDPNALYIECYPSKADFKNELEKLKSQTSFEGFDFTKYNIDDCEFDGLFLRGSSFEDMQLENVSFRNCVLASADFDGATLIDCDFSHANLELASLDNCQIEDCEFYRADLEKASIYNFQGDISIFEDASYLPESLTHCDHCERLVEKDDISAIHELGDGVCEDCYDRYEDEHACERCGVVVPYIDNYYSSLCSQCEDEDEDDDEDDED